MTDKEMSDLVLELFKRLHEETPANAMSIITLLAIMIFKNIESEAYNKTIEEFADHMRSTIVEGYHDNSVGLLQ
jgi:hypothetical protein